MIESLVKDVSLDYLSSSKVGEKLQRAMQVYERAQEIALTSIEDNSSDSLKKIRVGTILTFGLLKKTIEGKSIKSFSREDWLEIANSVAQYAIVEGDERYSILIFSMYADYVDASTMLLKEIGVPHNKIEAIQILAEEVRNHTSAFQNGQVSEVDYTEKCLWLLLEALIKMMAAYSSKFVGEDRAEFLESASALAFEYARYSLYKQELQIVTCYLDNQKQLDEELRAKFDAYNRELKARQKEFDNLLENAFSDDISNRLKSSVGLAHSIGVKDEEVLDSIDKIDDFFM